jgi:hypothetical protein
MIRTGQVSIGRSHGGSKKSIGQSVEDLTVSLTPVRWVQDTRNPIQRISRNSELSEL